jgi:predicted transcriptional regulator
MIAQKMYEMLRRIASWLREYRDVVANPAREFQTRRTNTYRLTDDERAAVREGLEQARRGEFVPDAEMKAFWKSSGVA